MTIRLLSLWYIIILHISHYLCLSLPTYNFRSFGTLWLFLLYCRHLYLLLIIMNSLRFLFHSRKLVHFVCKKLMKYLHESSERQTEKKETKLKRQHSRQNSRICVGFPIPGFPIPDSRCSQRFYLGFLLTTNRKQPLHWINIEILN